MIKYKNDKIIDWGFNLSYSTLSSYKDSQLLFYWNKINPIEADTKVANVYSMIGNIIHEIAELYIADKSINVVEEFDKEWINKKIDKEWSPYKINKAVYKACVIKLKDYIDNNLTNIKNIKTEMNIEFVKPEYSNLTIKGFIDVVYETNNGEIILADWKTNSTAKYEDYFFQRRFYAWLFYKKFNKIPKLFKWIYLRKDIIFEDTFTLEDIQAVEDDVQKFIKEIKEKGNDINKYELGDIDGFFNDKKKACLLEKARRENKNINEDIKLVYKNNSVIFFSGLTERLIKILQNKYSYKYTVWEKSFNSNGTPIFETKFGKRKIKLRPKEYTKNLLSKINNTKYYSLPIGFKYSLVELLNEYINYYKLDIKIKIIDKNILDYNYKFNNMPKKLTVDLFDHQIKAKNNSKDWCIYNCCVSSGKTVMGAEFIREKDTKTLWLTHKIELVNQTYNELNEKFGDIKAVGKIQGTQEDFNHQVIVTTFQTLYARINNPKYKQLISDVECIVVDECHHLATANVWKEILNKIQSTYRLGLTGSIPETPEHKLNLEAQLGPTVIKITEKEMMQLGKISKPTIKMFEIKHKQLDDEYRIVKMKSICDSVERNNIIIDICKKEKGLKLIVVDMIMHGMLLNKLIPNSVFINGQIDSKVRESLMDDVRNHKVDVVISNVIGEGVSINHIINLIIASGGKSPIATIQNPGRLMRLFNGKEKKLFDFYDNQKYLKEHSEIRKKAYEKYANVEVI